jgi:peptide/nickel transport system ATP-binding protein
MTAALAAEGLSRVFGGGRRLLGPAAPAVHAVQEVDLAVAVGETVGVVGESGCGKSTLARMLVGLDRPSGGRVLIDGEESGSIGRHRRSRRVQYVFQHPHASLNPRKTVRRALEAPMRRLLGLGAAEREGRLARLAEATGLGPDLLDRHPHELSGGQAQRVAVARALAAEAKIVVFDEPVSALDVSVQAQVLNLLDRLKRQFRLTYVFISHDLSVVESVADRVAVMYFGRIVEIGRARDLFRRPRHPYTDLLMRSAPAPGKRRIEPERGAPELPDPTRPPPGCPFAPRCPRVADRCRVERPLLDGAPGQTRAACWRPLDAA